MHTCSQQGLFVSERANNMDMAPSTSQILIRFCLITIGHRESVTILAGFVLAWPFSPHPLPCFGLLLDPKNTPKNRGGWRNGTPL